MENHINTVKSFTENRTLEKNTLVSIVYPVKGINFSSILEEIRGGDNVFFFSERPDEGTTILGIDSTFDISIYGDDRVTKTAEVINKIEQKFIHNWNEFKLSLPLFLGGMKFSANESDNLWSGFSDSDWFIPKFLFIELNNKTYLAYNIFTDSLDNQGYSEELQKAYKLLNLVDRDRKQNIKNRITSTNKDDIEEKINWNEKVNSALSKIESGEVQKIVLSRQVEFELENKGNISCIVKKLAERYPGCYIFAYKKNGSIFFGASPEKLAKISNGWIEADALAGSISRSSDSKIDNDLAEELLSSEKNLEEQQVVVSFIVDSFSKFCDEIIYEEKPIIRKLPNIQHLWTPIKAKLKSPKSIFSILEEIHPTPAICGVPWTNALYSIKEMENHSRGLFSGMIGWFNFNNEGEFAVAIRSALMKEKSVYAFAGCGIVKGSNPENEFEESELKLKPILSHFENETIYQL